MSNAFKNFGLHISNPTSKDIHTLAKANIKQIMFEDINTQIKLETDKYKEALADKKATLITLVEQDSNKFTF